jgi:hypothetical protein
MSWSRFRNSIVGVTAVQSIVHNFLQVHAETFPVIVELGAEVFHER